eukprot:SM000046S16396  [mRNA]  locus=s46:458083:458858:+ [translate_table: standard]
MAAKGRKKKLRQQQRQGRGPAAMDTSPDGPPRSPQAMDVSQEAASKAAHGASGGSSIREKALGPQKRKVVKLRKKKATAKALANGEKRETRAAKQRAKLVRALAAKQLY